MSNNEIVGDFMKNTLMPLSIVFVLGILLSPFCKVGESVDFGVLFVYCSLPFGVYLVMKKFKPDKNIKTFAKIITVILAVFGGCAIGVAALAWTLCRAFGYIPYTVWRFAMKDSIKSQNQEEVNYKKPNYGTSSSYEVTEEKQQYNEYIIPEDPLMDDKQIEIMRKIQELNEKRK